MAPITEQQTSPSITACAICGQPCKLEDCVTDEHGRAVHKECYRAYLSEKGA